MLETTAFWPKAKESVIFSTQTPEEELQPRTHIDTHTHTHAFGCIIYHVPGTPSILVNTVTSLNKLALWDAVAFLYNYISFVVCIIYASWRSIFSFIAHACMDNVSCVQRYMKTTEGHGAVCCRCPVPVGSNLLVFLQAPTAVAMPTSPLPPKMKRPLLGKSPLSLASLLLDPSSPVP